MVTEETKKRGKTQEETDKVKMEEEEQWKIK